tara:strand:+ start:660 stop:815 length:156 start_codon:yes stop_codon:yes gene_type:complete
MTSDVRPERYLNQESIRTYSLSLNYHKLKQRVETGSLSNEVESIQYEYEEL